MNNTATRMIRSEEITIDMRICTILAGGKKPGEVYFAAIAPDMELTVITLDEAPDILPCFDESNASIHLPDTSLLLCYNPAQVLKMAGKRYLTGPVILVRTNMDGNFISLTIDDVYRFQKFLASHSVTLMADDQKLPCICIVLRRPKVAGWRSSAAGIGRPASQASIERAARLPWPIATVTLRSPGTMSPPAKMPGQPVIIEPSTTTLPFSI